MESEYMVFEVTSFEMPEDSNIPIVEMENVDKLLSFVHMVSVDQERVPIFKMSFNMALLQTSHWVYFCFYQGVMIRAYRQEEQKEAKEQEVVPSVVDVSPVM